MKFINIIEAIAERYLNFYTCVVTSAWAEEINVP
jgi:hypothetical protein